MNQAEIISAIAVENGLNNTQAKGALKSLVDLIQNGLKKEARFSIAGVGTFTVGQRAARVGRNPATGEKLKIKASKTVRFKAAPALKEAAAKAKLAPKA